MARGAPRRSKGIASGMALVLLLSVSCARSPRAPLDEWGARAALALRARLHPRAGEVSWPAAADLSDFYLARADRPAWCGPRGPRAQADALLAALAAAGDEGLDPQDYKLAQIEAALSRWRRPQAAPTDLAALVEVDILLSNAFLHYGAHLLRGRIDPRRIHRYWRAPYVRGGLAGLLQTALDLNQVGQALEELRPPQAGYARLRAALSRYRHLAAAGGWGQVGGWSLEKRLRATGDWRPRDDAPTALRRFQRRHGLPVTGRLDAATQAALDEPVESRIAQIELNMERWRWLPHGRATRYVLVRLDDYQLDVVRAGRTVLTSRVIVGKPYWRTPIFSAEMTQVVFNPYWYVPQRIAVAEILPRVRRDPDYLARQGFVVSRGEGLQARPVDAHAVDWQQVQEEDFPYHFAQAPGPANPLGRIKFLFPNPYDVYLHDTPHAALFARSKREFSHGCIRVEASAELAALLLDGWEREEVEQQMESGQNRQVWLPHPLPVFVLYWTAWVDEEGLLHFRDDAYEGDARLRAALAGGG